MTKNLSQENEWPPMQQKPFDERLKSVLDRVEEAKACCGREHDDIRIMAVTKTVEAKRVNEALRCGIDLIGENRVQEFLSKNDEYLPCEKHFIGHLQSNKVKYIIDKVDCIESVSSVALAREISRQALKKDIPCLPVLLQVNIGREDSKSGFYDDMLYEALCEVSQMDRISVRGLMCIPPKEDAERYLAKMENLFIDMKGKNIHNIHMDVLSMGMSMDYESAIRHGSTLIRLGTVLFGARDGR